MLVLYSLPPDVLAAGRVALEFDLRAAAENIAAVVPGASTAAVRGAASEILDVLSTRRPDVVFNLCEAPLGRPELEAAPAMLLEWVGVRFTGCRSETISLCRRKDRTKVALLTAGVPVPPSAGFPCIVKPVDQDGSVGIDSESVCDDEAAMARAVARLPGPAFVEAFVPGREFNVALWGQNAPAYVSIGEMCYRNGLRLNTYASKWAPDSEEFANSPIDYETALAPDLRTAIVDAARGAWYAVGARGYARVDVRLDEAGLPCVLDVNPNPEISPDSGICRAVQEAGWGWEQFIRQQIEWA